MTIIKMETKGRSLEMRLRSRVRVVYPLIVIVSFQLILIAIIDVLLPIIVEITAGG
jgi:hypothetical protein